MNMLIFTIITSCFAIISPYNTLPVLGESHYFPKWFQSSPEYTENLYVYMPIKKSRSQQSFPIVLFFSGFGSNLPQVAYKEVVNEISTKANGAVVVGWDGLGVSNPLDMPGIIKRVDQLVEYSRNGSLQASINREFSSPVVVDPSRLFFMGHSSGSQIAYLLANKYPALGLILLDPVDSDPVKWTKPVIPLDSQVDYDKPVLVVASGRGGVSGIQAGNVAIPPCCPANYSATHFYDSFVKGPKFYLEATVYGHADLLSPDPIAWAGHLSRFCATVADPKVNPFQAYRDLVSGAVASFLATFGSSSQSLSCQYSKYLTDNSTLQVDGFINYSHGFQC